MPEMGKGEGGSAGGGDIGSRGREREGARLGPLTGVLMSCVDFYKMVMSHVSVPSNSPCPLSNLRNGHVKYCHYDFQASAMSLRPHGTCRIKIIIIKIK